MQNYELAATGSQRINVHIYFLLLLLFVCVQISVHLYTTRGSKTYDSKTRSWFDKEYFDMGRRIAALPFSCFINSHIVSAVPRLYIFIPAKGTEGGQRQMQKV